MTQTNHPTDDVLLELVNDEQCETHHDDVETHISNCGQCQTRLMSLVGHDWLDDYRDCLSAEFLSETSHPGLKGSPADKNEFETGAIEQMLKKVLAPPTHPETLGRLGRYEVESVIGVGGMGLVLRGYDRELQRPVAIKMMLPRLANNGRRNSGSVVKPELSLRSCTPMSLRFMVSTKLQRCRGLLCRSSLAHHCESWLTNRDHFQNEKSSELVCKLHLGWPPRTVKDWFIETSSQTISSLIIRSTEW